MRRDLERLVDEVYQQLPPTAEYLHVATVAVRALHRVGALLFSPDYLYRVVERPVYTTDDSGLPWGGVWKWAGTGWGRPRTYRTLTAARSVASRLRAQYAWAGVQMEVAVQRAPVGAWERVLSEAEMIDMHAAEECRRHEAGEAR